MQLIIGNKNYSSWSLRAWLALEANGLPFDETLLKLDTPEFYASLKKLNPSAKVPALIDDGLLVWDSMSILDYLDKKYPEAGIWPKDLENFALSKSMSAEMHSGFQVLRSAMPMNIRENWTGFEFSDTLIKDISRVQDLWTEALSRSSNKGPYLFGKELTGADFMFAPVVFRFKTYDVTLNTACKKYSEAFLAHPAVKSWVEAALSETDIVALDEIDQGKKRLG